MVSVKRDTGSLADLLEDKGKGSQRPTTMVGTDENKLDGKCGNGGKIQVR